MEGGGRQAFDGQLCTPMIYSERNSVPNNNAVVGGYMFQREGDGKCRAVMQLSGYIARGVLPTYVVISEGREEEEGERGLVRIHWLWNYEKKSSIVL